MAGLDFEDIKEQNYYLIKGGDITRLLRQASTAPRIYTTSEVMFMLSIKSYDKFYEHIKKKECLIRPSSKRGKWVAETVHKEAERLNK